MKNTHMTLIGIGSMLAFAGAAQAGTIVQSGSLGAALTNWSETFQIDQFNDMGGTLHLNEVIIELVGTMDASAGAENRDSYAKSITMDMLGMFSIDLDGESLAYGMTGISESFSLGAFDGVIDFAGASGKLFNDLTSTAVAEESYSELTRDMSPWIGAGELSLNAFANAESLATGGGNIIFLFQSNASIDYTITYVYSSLIVPTPTAAGLGLAGLAGIAGRRRRRA